VGGPAPALLPGWGRVAPWVLPSLSPFLPDGPPPARLGEGVEEVIDARIYSGIHFRTADEDGAQTGHRIARFVVNQAFRVRGPSK
jgi:hypothetical protein